MVDEPILCQKLYMATPKNFTFHDTLYDDKRAFAVLLSLERTN